MKGFQVTGSFADERQEKGRQLFNVEVAAEDEAAAKEQITSTIGSKHKIKRWQIEITNVKELAAEEITDHIVKYKVLGE